MAIALASVNNAIMLTNRFDILEPLRGLFRAGGADFRHGWLAVGGCQQQGYLKLSASRRVEVMQLDVWI